MFFSYLERFAVNFVTMIDFWVLVVTVLTLLYLIIRYPQFKRKEVATTYMIFMGLFVFWSLRNIGQGVYQGQSLPLFFAGFSVVLDLAVVTFSAYLFYHFWRTRDIDYIKKKLAIETRQEEGGEKESPEGSGAVRPGYNYLVLETGTEYGFELFRDAAAETPGLCFSRSHPLKIKERHGLKETPIFWFTEKEDAEGEKGIEPFRLNFLQELIMEFVNTEGEEEEGVILIDGLEYLLFKNSYEKIMDFVERLIDSLSERDGVSLIVSIDADSLGRKKLALLREEFDEVREVDEGDVSVLHY